MTATIQRQIRKRRQIPLLTICFMASMCNGFVVYKFVPIITTLMTYWGVQEGQIGILQSANSWIAVFLLVPLGYFQRRVSPRISGSTAFALLIFGNILGFLTPNFYLLVAARIFEGLGAITISTLSQNLVYNSFTDRRTSAVGVLNCGQYVGQAVNIFISNALVHLFGWRVVYFYMFVFEAVLIVFWIFFTNRSVTIEGLKDATEKRSEVIDAGVAGGHQGNGMKAVLKNKYLWMLTISSALYGPAIINFSSYIPTYLTTRGMELAQANSLYNVSVVCGMLSMLFSGFLSDKLGTRRKLAIFANIATIGIYFLLLRLPLSYIIIFMVLLGLVPRMISVLTFSSISTVVGEPADVPLANSVFTTVAQITNIVGNIAVGFLIQKMGYQITLYVVMVILLICAGLWVTNRKVK